MYEILEKFLTNLPFVNGSTFTFTIFFTPDNITSNHTDTSYIQYTQTHGYKLLKSLVIFNFVNELVGRKRDFNVKSSIVCNKRESRVLSDERFPSISPMSVSHNRHLTRAGNISLLNFSPIITGRTLEACPRQFVEF